MVGRFESPELKKEALAHEDLCARSGLLGRCSCMLGVFLMVAGIFSLAPMASLSRLLPASRSPTPGPPEPPSPSPLPPSKASELPGLDARDFGTYSYSSGGAYGYGSGAYGYGSGGALGGFESMGGRSSRSRDEEERPQMGLDFSLIAICVSVISLFVAPMFLRAPQPTWQAPSWEPGPGAWGSAAAWGAGASAGPPGSLLAPAGGLGGPFVSDPAASHGRLVDVKPGELRGAASGGFAFGGLGGFGSGFGGGSGMDWSSTAPAGGSSWGLGSWMSPVPSAHAGQTGLTGMLPSLAGLGGFGLGQSAGGVLPTEADLTDTYAALGVELQHWTPALAAFVDREIVVPLVQALEESDQVWQQALASKGWRLTLDAPRLAMAGFGPTSQEVSIFDRNLPRPLSDDPGAVQMWGKRQQLEAYLVHPCYEPSQRQYVFERLREWRQRGLANAMRFEYRAADSLPTDAHILENIVVKLLQGAPQLDFASCFMAAGHSPPMQKHMGQTAVAYLRQVTDQSLTPKPAPHYEVVTQQKVWRLRPGNANILEALALLLHALRRHSGHSRSYQSFPQVLRTAFEATVGAGGASSHSRPVPWF